MLEQLFPADSFLGVGLQHPFNEVLTHVRDVVDTAGEIKVLLVYHGLQLIDILCVIRRS